MFEHVLYDFPDENTAAWQEKHLGDIVTYVCVDSGLVIFKTRENSRQKGVEDTTFFFSEEYIRSGKFQVGNSIGYIDTMQSVEDDLKNMYLLTTNNGISSLSSYRKVPDFILHLVEIVGKTRYAPNINDAKNSVVSRLSQINTKVFSFTLFPSLIFSPPVIKEDEEVQE